MKCLNPLQVSVGDSIFTASFNEHLFQMKRAVRDYKYEVNEGRMTDECVQYLTQLQKDWERHRVKLGVEALRKEVLPFVMLRIYARLTLGFRWASEKGIGNAMKVFRRRLMILWISPCNQSPFPRTLRISHRTRT